MLHRMHLENFKAHRSTDIEFGRFTMFVGDNASGKTSALDALWLQSALTPDPTRVLRDAFSPPELLRRGSEGPISIDTAGVHHGQQNWTARVDIATGKAPWHLSVVGTANGSRFEAKLDHSGSGPLLGAGLKGLTDALGVVGLYRFRGDRIANAAYSEVADPVVGSDGTDTAVALESLKLGDDEAFDRIQDSLRVLIPSVQRIKLRRAEVIVGGKKLIGSKIYFDFRGAKDVPAHNASHGTLVVLALLTVVHGPKRPNVLLLDELDQALHPRAQIALVQTLRRLLEQPQHESLQIVATTHSPYILDGIEPSCVQAFALRDDGTVATKRLSEHPDAGKVAGLLSGQLWSLDSERDWVLRDQAA